LESSSNDSEKYGASSGLGTVDDVELGVAASLPHAARMVVSAMALARWRRRGAVAGSCPRR